MTYKPRLPPSRPLPSAPSKVDLDAAIKEYRKDSVTESDGIFPDVYHAEHNRRLDTLNTSPKPLPLDDISDISLATLHIAGLRHGKLVSKTGAGLCNEDVLCSRARSKGGVEERNCLLFWDTMGSFDSFRDLDLNPFGIEVIPISLRCMLRLASSPRHGTSRVVLLIPGTDDRLESMLPWFEMFPVPHAFDELGPFLDANFISHRAILDKNTTVFQYADEAYYWPLEPTGNKTLSAEVATMMGFPPQELQLRVWTRSWNEPDYAGLCQFQQGKDFDYWGPGGERSG
ncbi:hypothetical protein B0H10DRAFT_1951653 [Mycena sp. CBHHK59/15]|nr:hypothetical protein B0H10DRAFT_1951653 [Mycena sp. CBHHK59/15]